MMSDFKGGGGVYKNWIIEGINRIKGGGGGGGGGKNNSKKLDIIYDWSLTQLTNVCFKKTGTRRISVLLLRFVPVFLKQTLCSPLLFFVFNNSTYGLLSRFNRSISFRQS